MKKLTCAYCGKELHLSLGFNGCDWESVAGEGSGYDWELRLECEAEGCGHVFPLVRLRKNHDLCEVIESLRPYVGKMNG